MKKIVFFLLLLSALFIVGCEEPNGESAQSKVVAIQLDRPEGLGVKGDRIFWNSVSNSNGYYIRLEIGNESFEKYTGMEVSSLISDLIAESGTVKFSVKAHGNGQYFLDSEWSEQFCFDYIVENKETSSTKASPTPTRQIAEPTAEPTIVPVAEPTAEPTKIPTATPTQIITQIPTATPTQIITQTPTAIPTQNVAQTPTSAPTSTAVINKVESDGFFIDFYNNTGEKYGEEWWGLSEVCGYIEKIKMNLSSGVLNASVFIGEGELLDGEYGVEISICKSRSPFDYVSFTTTRFNVTNGVFNFDDRINVEPLEDGYSLSLNCQYSIQEPVEEYYLVAKLHTSVDKGNGTIVFYNFNILDLNFGLKPIDIRADGVRVSAERLCTGEKVNCTVSNSGIWVPEIQGNLFEEDKEYGNAKLGIATSFYDKKDAVYNDDWWYESEVNVYIEHVKLPSSSGMVIATAIVNDYQFEDGNYGLEITLCENNTINYTVTKFTITDGVIASHDKKYEYRRAEMGYEIQMMTNYVCDDSSKEVSILFKLHSDANNCDGTVVFKDISFIDKTNGKQYLSLESDGIIVSGERLCSNEEVEAKIVEIKDNLRVSGIKQLLYTGEVCKLTTEEKLTFKSSSNIVAHVDSEGLITAVAPGKTRITVENEEGGTFSWVMEVRNPYLEVKTKKTRILLADTYFFEVKPYGYKMGNVTWDTSDKTVGKIEANGKFTALKVGNTTITLKDSAGYSYSFDVEVFDVNDRDILQYIIMHDNEEVDEELKQKIYDHLIAVYKNVYSTFGDGTYHTINVYFDHIDFAAAYATMDFSSSDHFEIHIGIETMANNIHDVDCVTHELIHTAQNYPFATKFGEDRIWLGEGLTDYGRYLLGVQNEKANWNLTKYQPGQRYTDSYRTTASFIKYVVDVHDPVFAQKLNDAFRNREYTEELWKDATGYTIDELWEMYKRQ